MSDRYLYAISIKLIYHNLGNLFGYRVTSNGLSSSHRCPITPDGEKNNGSNLGIDAIKLKISQDQCDLKSNSPLLLPKTVLVSSEKDHCLDTELESDKKRVSSSEFCCK